MIPLHLPTDKRNKSRSTRKRPWDNGSLAPFEAKILVERRETEYNTGGRAEVKLLTSRVGNKQTGGKRNAAVFLQ
jgi:hypothetical protein